MMVIVKMKDGTLYKGIKCGTEGGFVFIVNPWLLTKDDLDGAGMMDDEYMESPVGEVVCKEVFEKVRIIQIPVADVEIIESAKE